MLRFAWKYWPFTLGLAILISSLRAGEADPLDAYLEHAGNATEDELLVAAADELEGDPARELEVERVNLPGEDEEWIKVEVEVAENDLLTMEALEKLEVVIESLEFANADLRNVIRIIGERLDINFIFDTDEITGAVSLRLRNVRLRDALDSILTTRKLAIVTDPSGIFRIVPQEQIGRQLIETRTEVIQLNWISAEDVVLTMEAFLTDNGTMRHNEESNSIIITDVPPQIEVIRDLIGQIDKPERQVMLEARLVDINVGALKDLGTQWNVAKLNENLPQRTTFENEEGDRIIPFVDPTTGLPGTLSLTDVFQRGITEILDPRTGAVISSANSLTDPFDGSLISNVIDPVAGIGDPLALTSVLLEGLGFAGGQGTLQFGDTIGILGNDFNVHAAFNALETRNVVEVLANPRVTTLNNVPAQIAIIERIPYLEAAQGPTQGVTVAEVEFEPVGVDITVKPIITPNGFVRLEIGLLQRIFRQRVPVSIGSSGTTALDPPQVDERLANTNVIVRSDYTVCLGGFRGVQRRERVDGVPWLHRIPLLGWLFKNKAFDQTRTELVLMMTPQIIEEEIALLDREKVLYEKIDTDWHLPDYYYDDVRDESDK